MTERGVAFLKQSQNDDGGWGYGVGQASSVEATAAAVLALQPITEGGATGQRGAAWLQRTQHADGGWGCQAQDTVSGWSTAWALLALRGTGFLVRGARRRSEDGGARSEGERTASFLTSPSLTSAEDWLVKVEAVRSSDDSMMKDVAQKLGIDASLRGWPWLPRQAAWVEPTALAILALAASAAQEDLHSRLGEGAQYLVNRRCQLGGWNFGNPFMLGSPLPPRAYPTAWALLALKRVAPEAISGEDSVALRTEMRRDGGTLALAWGLVALGAVNEGDSEMAARLAGAQRPDGSWNGNPYQTAAAMMVTSGAW